MVIEKEIPTFVEWLFGTRFYDGGLFTFLLVIALLLLAGTFLGFVRKSFQLGPSEAFYAVAKVFESVVIDLRHFSFRRVFAIAKLAVQEAIRRRVIVVFAIFVVILLFAGWFLDAKSDHPAIVYLSFVLTATNYLIMPLSLFLAAFSLPNDMKSRVIYTVITKPVRASEIVLGRILGFAFVGTVILSAMCLVSYFFVVRGLHHSHEVDEKSLVVAADGSVTGTTTADAYHRHEFTLDAQGVGRTDTQVDHWHEVRREGEGPHAKYVLGPPQGTLQARLPVYGKLTFYDRDGKLGSGVNVGNEWTYRSYLEGGTLASAVWEYSGITEQDFPNGFPLELTLRVFRTHKGNIERGIPGTIRIKNPSRNAKIRESVEFPFIAKDNGQVDQQFIGRELKARDVEGTLRDVDLFKDLVHEGRVQVEIRCTAGGQYFGMAQADVYLRAADRSFALNFIKGYLGIWVQMLLVTCYGVLFSTFLSGAVAMIATIGTIILGFFRLYLARIASGEEVGGGPVESLLRIVTQMSISVDLEFDTKVQAFIKGVDFVWLKLMDVFAALIPDYGTFDNTAFVAYGYDLSPGLIAAQLCTATGYFLIVSCVAYICLKIREVAA